MNQNNELNFFLDTTWIYSIDVIILGSGILLSITLTIIEKLYYYITSHLTSERPKPEFSAETGTGTQIIPVRFRLGNSYRNRNGPLLLL